MRRPQREDDVFRLTEELQALKRLSIVTVPSGTERLVESRDPISGVKSSVNLIE